MNYSRNEKSTWMRHKRNKRIFAIRFYSAIFSQFMEKNLEKWFEVQNEKTILSFVLFFLFTDIRG